MPSRKAARRAAKSAAEPRTRPTAPPLGRAAGLWIFGVAFALRAAHVIAIRGNPWFDVPIIDAATYDAAARAIAAGQGHPDAVYWQPPGYAYFLGGLYALTGGATLVTRLVQAALGAVTALLTARLGTLAFGRRVGIAAGLIVATYGTLIHFDAELLPTALGIPLQLGALLVAEQARRRPAWKGWAVAGAMAGAAATVVANALLYAVIAAIAARRHAPVVIAAAALVVLPFTLRNAGRGGEPVLISYNAGINFFIGNNPDPRTTIGIRPDLGWKALSSEPGRLGIRGYAAGSNYFAGKSLAWAAREPGAFALLQGRKVAEFLGGHEVERNQAIYPFRAWSPVLAVTLWQLPWLAFPYGLLAPLAMIGLIVAWRRSPLLAASLVVYSASVVAFFVTARYRLPVVPLAAIFAAAGVAWFLREPLRKPRVVAVAGAVVIALIANLAQPPASAVMNVDAEYSLGAALMAAKKPLEARPWFERTVARAPNYTEAWTNLGILAATEGRPEEAERAFTRAVEVAPAEGVVLVNLARWRERQGRSEEALLLYERAVTVDPADRETRARRDALRAAKAALSAAN
jgi:tetratricopeptide (TPR) repeat protein